MKMSPWSRMEAAVLLALCVALCHGTAEARQLGRLQENVLRLHVIGADDSAGEQAVKLQVQQAVYPVAEQALEGCDSLAQAKAAMEAALPALQRTARQAAEGRTVSVELGRQRYGRREADGYALPAGEYWSVQVRIGAAAGRNWWGVIFPELSMDSAGDYTEAARILGEGNVRLITGQEQGVELRWRCWEWLSALLDKLRG